MPATESRSLIIRDLTSNTADKEMKKACEWYMKVSADVYNELINVVFSKGNYKYPALVHHEGVSSGIVLTKYIFSYETKKTLSTIKPSNAQYLYNFIFRHDITGKLIAGGSDTGIYSQLKRELAPFISAQEFNAIINNFWSMFRSAAFFQPLRQAKKENDTDRLDIENYPRQRIYNNKELYIAELTNCPYDKETQTLTLKNPIVSPTPKKPLPEEEQAIWNIFERNKVIDLSRTIKQLSSGDLKFEITAAKPNVSIQKTTNGNLRFIMAYKQTTEIELGRKDPAEINGRGYILWNNEKFMTSWAVIKKKNKKLPKERQIYMKKAYLDFISKCAESILVIDPNVNRLAMVIVKKSNIIDVINLDISKITYKNECNREKTRFLKKKLARNGKLTSKQYQTHTMYMVDYRTNFQHHIAKEVMDVVKQYNVKHILFGNCGKANRGLKRFKNIKNLSFITITKYIQELAREQDVIFCEVNEYYTSKASFLDKEQPTNETIFSAIRGEADRHTLKRKNGSTVDADINAACNIAVRHGILNNDIARFKKVQYKIHNPTKKTLDI